ncbi:unnamed protein product [Closterium sp. NIES-65]|nr:unnamed protein product [Closterium sp. NIES-65]
MTTIIMRARNSSSRFIAKLLAALLAAALLLPSTNAATYPNCPLTGKPPTKPTVPPTRCVGVSHLSCCPDACADLNFAVQALGVNVTAAVWPTVGFADISPKDVPASIGIFMKDSGSYLTGKPGKYMLRICGDDYTVVIYGACYMIRVGETFLADQFFTAEDIIQGVIVPLVAQQIPGFNATFSDTNCYSKNNTSIPVTPLCCDPLTIPATCPPGAVNMTAAKGVSGRPLDPAVCADFPYSNATRPLLEPYTDDIDTPYHSPPAPSLPPPTHAPSPPAPALSPPTPSPPAPITGAPPPSVVSPSPPSVSPPTGPIPSPPPAVPSPSPPPPKAAGRIGASLAVAVLPLLMVVLMAGV